MIAMATREKKVRRASGLGPRVKNGSEYADT